MHEGDLGDSKARGLKPRTKLPKVLRDCIPGDRVIIAKTQELVIVTNSTLAGTCWVRPILEDGTEGEFQSRHRDLPIQVVELH